MMKGFFDAPSDLRMLAKKRNNTEGPCTMAAPNHSSQSIGVTRERMVRV